MHNASEAGLECMLECNAVASVIVSPKEALRPIVRCPHLRSVPVEPGLLFGSAAVEELQRTIQARETSVATVSRESVQFYGMNG